VEQCNICPALLAAEDAFDFIDHAAFEDAAEQERQETPSRPPPSKPAQAQYDAPSFPQETPRHLRPPPKPRHGEPPPDPAAYEETPAAYIDGGSYGGGGEAGGGSGFDGGGDRMEVPEVPEAGHDACPLPVRSHVIYHIVPALATPSMS